MLLTDHSNASWPSAKDSEIRPTIYKRLKSPVRKDELDAVNGPERGSLKEFRRGVTSTLIKFKVEKNLLLKDFKFLSYLIC